jgi:hypothetical protein
MSRLSIAGAMGWGVPGIGIAAATAVGAMLRPHAMIHPERAAVIASMQIVIVAGAVCAVVARLSPPQISRPLIAVLAATACGLIAAVGGLLPAAEIAQITAAECLWCVFVYGFSAVIDHLSGDDRRVPLLAVAWCVILPLWPIVAAPLIGATANTVASGPMNFILGLSPCIWLVHITQGTTGMNTMGWFHSHLLYRIVPLGQNVLMPKVAPWYWPATVLGASGAGMMWLSAWRRKRTTDARSDRLASAQQCR